MLEACMNNPYLMLMRLGKGFKPRHDHLDDQKKIFIISMRFLIYIRRVSLTEAVQ
jgi:hypothetical protein